MDAPQLKTTPEVDTQPAQCEKHGEYVAHRLIGKRFTGCPTCASEAEEANRRSQEAAAKAQREAYRLSRINALRELSGLTGRLAESSFDSYHPKTPKQKTALAECMEYAAQFQPGQEPPPAWTLWLVGPVGTGKSHLGAAMVNDLTNRGISARMHSMKGLLRFLRSTWDKESAPVHPGWEDEGGYHDGHRITEDEAIRGIASCKLLVIDEIGMIFDSPADRVQLFEVLDQRYNLRNPTVLLTNLTATQIKESLGDRLYDRLREGASMKVVDGQSARGDFATRGAS